MNTLKKLVILLLSLIYVGAFAQNVTKIGVLAPLTGGSAADGEEMIRGAQLAINELNASGGVAGYTFELVRGDVGDQEADAVISAIERMSSDSAVNAMMTGYASPTNFEIEYMAELTMPYLISANAAQTEEIIAQDPDQYGTVWSVSPSFDAYNSALVPLVENLAKAGELTLKNHKVALISSDNPYSMSIYDGLTENFRAAGWEITMNEVVPFGEVNDWRTLLNRIRQDPPDVIVNTDYQPGNAATFVNQFTEDPTDSLVFIQYAPSVPEFVSLTKAKSTGILYNLLGGAISSNKRAQDIIAKYKEAYGTEPGTYGVALYEQVHLYADALEQVGDPSEREAIGSALAATDKQTAMGRVRFDPATHLAVQGEDSIPILFYQLWEGDRVLFSPETYADGKFQLPGWMTK